MPKLTDAVVKATRAAAKDVTVFDSELPGFALKMTPKGKRVFLYQYWSPVERTKRRRFTIGALGDALTLANGATVTITPTTARAEAERLRGIVRAKRDPFTEAIAGARAEEVERKVERARRAAQRPVREIADELLADLTDARKSPRTLREYRRLLDKHLLPVVVSGVPLGARAIMEVGKLEAVAVQRQKALRDRPVLANRVQQLARSLVNYAERIGARPHGEANPFGGKRWNAEAETREALTRAEVAALHDALELEDDGLRGGAVDAIRFLLYSGMRKSEALSLRWDAVDADTGMVTLGKTKTGRSIRPLSREALAVLATIPARGIYVFPSPVDANAPRTEVKRTWLRVRERARVTKPLHSLRHTVATVALSEGVPLATVGAMLGHRNASTTSRYAKMEGGAARLGADVAGAALAPVKPADVTPIHRKRTAK